MVNNRQASLINREMKTLVEVVRTEGPASGPARQHWYDEMAELASMTSRAATESDLYVWFMRD